jgi:hypothetical protein
MTAKLSALRTGHTFTVSMIPGDDPRAIMRLEGLDKLKILMTSDSIETTTFRLVAYCLKQLRYRRTVIDYALLLMLLDVTFFCMQNFIFSVSHSSSKSAARRRRKDNDLADADVNT